MKVGIDTFVEMREGPEPEAGAVGAARVADMMEEVKLADQIGLDTYAIGEHHRPEYVASSPATLLAAAAAVTKNITLSSAVTVLSSDDPVRVFQQFATVDLISGGRAEIVVGRGSFVESYPLFGYDTRDYDALFAEKLDLLLKLRDQAHITWQGEHRPSLHGEGVWPRPLQKKLSVRLGVGGTPASFVRAGTLGLPLTVAIIGGEPHRFRPMVDLYRRAWQQAGHDPAAADVAVHALGFVADTTESAAETLWPAYAHTFGRIGKERGWGPTSRAQFDATCGPSGAFLVGNPEVVAAKMLRISDSLGGVSQIAINLSGGVSHTAQMRAIELLGTAVRPLVQPATAVQPR